MQKSQEAESSTLISLSLLLGEDPEHLSQQLRATSLRDREPLGSPGLSKVGSEYLPFCTYEQPLAVEELAQLAEAGPGHEAGWSSRGSLFLEDSAPPSGFFPYYRSQEEHLASATTTPQGCSWCLGSRDPVPGSETQDGCHKVTARDGCLSTTPKKTLSGSSGTLREPSLAPAASLASSDFLLDLLNADPSSLPARGRKPLHSGNLAILEAPSAVQQRPLLAHLVRTAGFPEIYSLILQTLPKKAPHLPYL